MVYRNKEEHMEREKMETNIIINDDCLKVLKNMQASTIDCIVTSPPYNLGGDFHTFVAGKRVSYGGYKNFKDNLKEEDYQKNQIDVLNELYRVCKENGYCFYVHKERIKNNNIISPIEWIRKTKWLISQTIVLDMKSTANVDKRRFFPTHEYIYVLCKNKKSKLNNVSNLTSVWQVKKVPRKISGHPAKFDYNIPYECIKVATKEGDIVLDPYSGTGTTPLAAIMLNRKYIGIEIEKDYAERSIKELEEL